MIIGGVSLILVAIVVVTVLVVMKKDSSIKNGTMNPETTPASTTPASTTPASTTPASTPAFTTPVSQYVQGICPTGYVDKTNGNLSWQRCGDTCPAAKYQSPMSQFAVGPVDSSCNCACIQGPAPHVPSDYQLYGDWIGFGTWIQVQHIAYVPSINQNVFMTKPGETNTTGDLKMVSQDNTKARYIGITGNPAQVFDQSKWDNGNIADGHYNVIKYSDYEMYGFGISSPKTVQAVSYDPTINQLVFMIIDNGLLKMVSQDNTQSRNKQVTATDTVFSAYQWNSFNSYNNPGAGTYNVRMKN